MKRPVDQAIRLSKREDEHEVRIERGQLVITIDPKDLAKVLDPEIEERVRRALARKRDHRVLRTIYGAP